MDDYITLDEAAEMIPAKPSHTTVWRWCSKGIYVRGADQIVRMRFVRIGRKFFTKADWVEEFIHRLTAATMGVQKQHLSFRPDLSQKRLQQLADADEVLRQAGI